MQSLSGRIVSNLLCAVFHSPLINNAQFSNNAAKKRGSINPVISRQCSLIIPSVS